MVDWLAAAGAVVGAVGTLAAAIVALVLFWFTVKDRRIQQARLFSASLDGAVPRLIEAGTRFQSEDYPRLLDLRRGDPPRSVGIQPITGKVALYSDVDQYLAHYFLENASDEMLTNLRVSIVTEDGNFVTSQGTVRSLPAHHRYENQVQLFPVKRDKKGREYTVFKRGQSEVASMSVRVVFDDAVGRTWVRETGKAVVRFKPPKSRFKVRRRFNV
ncbi:MAG: hypothetical protein ACRDPJ_00655 [Nocardioidaceae bacterium]